MTHEGLPTPPTPELPEPGLGQRLAQMGRRVIAYIKETNAGETGLNEYEGKLWDSQYRKDMQAKQELEAQQEPYFESITVIVGDEPKP